MFSLPARKVCGCPLRCRYRTDKGIVPILVSAIPAERPLGARIPSPAVSPLDRSSRKAALAHAYYGQLAGQQVTCQIAAQGLRDPGRAFDACVTAARRGRL